MDDGRPLTRRAGVPIGTEPDKQSRAEPLIPVADDYTTLRRIRLCDDAVVETARSFLPVLVAHGVDFVERFDWFQRALLEAARTGQSVSFEPDHPLAVALEGGD